MLAIGRALMSRPKLLLLDEPSLGLAPILVQQIFSIIREINAQGMTILLVEQNALQALGVATSRLCPPDRTRDPGRLGGQPGRQPRRPPGLPRRDLTRPDPGVVGRSTSRKGPRGLDDRLAPTYRRRRATDRSRAAATAAARAVRSWCRSLVAVILVIALVKPWNAGGLVGSTPGAEATAGSGVPAASGPSDAVRPTSAPMATPGLTSDVLTPFVTPAPSGEGLIECLRFDAWRLLSISSSQGRLIRTWTAMTPRAGAGPDAVLDYPRVSDGVVLDVGYCGPIALLPGDARVGRPSSTWWRPDPLHAGRAARRAPACVHERLGEPGRLYLPPRDRRPVATAPAPRSLVPGLLRVPPGGGHAESPRRLVRRRGRGDRALTTSLG